jgi:amino acid transporter
VPPSLEQLGILSSSELLKQLARDRVVPSVFLNTLPVAGSPYVAVLSFVAFSGVLYASAGASLNIVSSMSVAILHIVLKQVLRRFLSLRFSIVWLSVMTLFPISLLLLKFNRRRLPRHPRTSLWVIFSALIVSPVIFAGNIAISPITFG